jgi:hypothetical protein
MPGPEAARQSAHNIDRALTQAAEIARLQESSRHSENDRRDIWDNITALRAIAAQNALILSKMDDLTSGQKALTTALSEHETKIDARLTALERRDERGKGAMAVLLAIASGIGGGAAITLQWAISHFWPAKP